MAQRLYLSIPIAISLLATLLALSALIQLGSVAQQAFKTHIAGISQQRGFDLHWATQLQPGQSLALIKDDRILSGHERVWVTLQGEVLGFLPEFQGGQQVREALRQGKQARAEILSVDPFDPARGVRALVRITS